MPHMAALPEHAVSAEARGHACLGVALAATPRTRGTAARALLGAPLLRTGARVGRRELEHELVTPHGAALRPQLSKLKPARGEELEHLLRLRHLERIAAQPVDQVVV